MAEIFEFDDIDTLRTNLERYYEKHDPEEIENIDDVIDMGMELGMDDLNKKMEAFYGESLNTFLKGINDIENHLSFTGQKKSSFQASVPDPYNRRNKAPQPEPAARQIPPRPTSTSSSNTSLTSSVLSSEYVEEMNAENMRNTTPVQPASKRMISSPVVGTYEVDGELRAALRAFYRKHDPARLDRMEDVYNVASQIGIDVLNSKLKGIYDDNLESFRGLDDDSEPAYPASPSSPGMSSPGPRVAQYPVPTSKSSFSSIGSPKASIENENKFFESYQSAEGNGGQKKKGLFSRFGTKAKKAVAKVQQSSNNINFKAMRSPQESYRNMKKAQAGPVPASSAFNAMDPFTAIEQIASPQQNQPAQQAYGSVWSSQQERAEFEEDLLQFYLKFDPRKVKLMDQVMELADSIGVQMLDDKLTKLYGMGPLHYKQYRKQKKIEENRLTTTNLPNRVPLIGVGQGFQLKSTGIDTTKNLENKPRAKKDFKKNFRETAKLRPVKTEQERRKKIKEVKAVTNFKKPATQARYKLMSVRLDAGPPGIPIARGKQRARNLGGAKVQINSIIEETRTELTRMKPTQRESKKPKREEKKISTSSSAFSGDTRRESDAESSDKASLPDGVDLAKIRSLILAFYQKYDPDKLRRNLDVKEMVEFTLTNGFDSLNDLLYSQYGKKINIDASSAVGDQSFQDLNVQESVVLGKYRVPETPVDQERVMLEKRVKKFYNKFDKSKLNKEDITRIVDYAMYHGVDKLNYKLVNKYGEGIKSEGLRTEAKMKTTRLVSQLLTKDDENDFDELKMKQRLRIFYSKHDEPYLNDPESLDKVINLMHRIGKSVVETKLEKLYGQSVQEVVEEYYYNK
eukprot:snap_masked-scaffold_29-processed-gene-2.57-mRNA-1 protein AED:1.00 eAED:1.00 QI:0/-1/0/0/-1/1/1/0/853